MNDYAVTLHRMHCLSCKRDFEFLTYITRTGRNRFSYDERTLPDTPPVTCFTLETRANVPVCASCLHSDLPNKWPTYRGTDRDNPELDIPHNGNTPNSGFTRWNRKPAPRRAPPSNYDPLAHLNSLAGAPCPTTSAVLPVATTSPVFMTTAKPETAGATLHPEPLTTPPTASQLSHPTTGAESGNPVSAPTPLLPT